MFANEAEVLGNRVTFKSLLFSIPPLSLRVKYLLLLDLIDRPHVIVVNFFWRNQADKTCCKQMSALFLVASRARHETIDFHPSNEFLVGVTFDQMAKALTAENMLRRTNDELCHWNVP